MLRLGRSAAAVDPGYRDTVSSHGFYILPRTRSLSDTGFHIRQVVGGHLIRSLLWTVRLHSSKAGYKYEQLAGTSLEKISSMRPSSYPKNKATVIRGQKSAVSQLATGNCFRPSISQLMSKGEAKVSRVRIQSCTHYHRPGACRASLRGIDSFLAGGEMHALFRWLALLSYRVCGF